MLFVVYVALWLLAAVSFFVFCPIRCLIVLLTRRCCILEDSKFDFRYVRLCDLDIRREKWLQTVEALIRFCGI